MENSGNKNLSDFARTTQDFPVVGNFNLALKTRLILAGFAICIFMPIFLLSLFALSRMFDTKRPDAEKERVIQKTTPPENDNRPLIRDIDPEREINRRAEVKLIGLLQENLKGVLEVKDGEAQTVRFNQAAIGKKGEFTPLKNGAVYDVWGYFICSDNGYGIIADEEKNLILLVWRSGYGAAVKINPRHTLKQSTIQRAKKLKSANPTNCLHKIKDN